MKRQIDVGALYGALESQRDAQQLSWRQLASELEISPSVFTNLAKGNNPDANTFVTLTGWLGLSPDRFVTGADPANEPTEETLAVIASYLRADKALKPKSAEAIESVLRAAYDQLAEPAAR